MNESTLVNKVWNYAHVLRDEGISYGAYVEQITYLLFLKMDDERDHQLGEPSILPKEWRWANLKDKDGDALELQYRHTLENLARESGLIGTIFRKAQSRIQDPAKLRRLVTMIDGETWLGLDVDVKGAIYEGLLERNAAEIKSGAGQYFTPRPLVRAMVEVVDPQPGMAVHDPACGTGGFLLAAYDHMKNLPGARDKQVARRLRERMLSGIDIVDEVVRLCAMNMYLHGIGGAESPVAQGDALAAAPGRRFRMVLTNPPFGKKSSYTYVRDDGDIERETMVYERADFIADTSNKQLNFLQHVMSVLEIPGSAAIVLPDNVLFEGGAGEKVRRRLLTHFDFHTLLRLPTGIFYKPGVKANVLFFDKKPASDEPWTKKLWIYDFRTNQHFTLKQNPLTDEHLNNFVSCYSAGNRAAREETERFRVFGYDELVARDKVNLDIFWLKDESLEDADSLPPPEMLAAEIVENLEAALEQFRGVAEELAPEEHEVA
jgi:type I restriction enzyme M protein